MMERYDIYKDIASRTQGDIYISVVGPVRTGKSTFIKRFMELMVLPKVDNTFIRQRVTDEAPVGLQENHHDHPAQLCAQ